MLIITQVPPPISYSHNDAVLQFCTDADNISIRVCKVLPDGSEEDIGTEWLEKPDENGCVNVLVQHIVGPCIPKLTCPDPGASDPFIQTNVVSYRVKATTVVKDKPEDSEELATDVLKMRKGGLSSKNDIKNLSGYLNDGGLTKFLTHCRDRLVTHCSPVILSFPVFATGDYFITAMDSLGNIGSSILISAEAGDVIAFPASYDALFAGDGCDAIKYSVAVASTLNPPPGSTSVLVGEQMDFTLRPHRSKFKYFMFCNSLGGYDGFHTEGDCTELVSIETKTKKDGDGCFSNYGTKGLPSFQVNTGPIFTEKSSICYKEILYSTWRKELVMDDTCDCPDIATARWCNIVMPSAQHLIKNNSGGKIDYAFAYTRDKEETVADVVVTDEVDVLNDGDFGLDCTPVFEDPNDVTTLQGFQITVSGTAPDAIEDVLYIDGVLHDPNDLYVLENGEGCVTACRFIIFDNGCAPIKLTKDIHFVGELTLNSDCDSVEAKYAFALVSFGVSGANGAIISILPDYSGSSLSGTIDWGDGVVDQISGTSGSISQNHNYAQDGLYNVTVDVQTDEGLSFVYQGVFNIVLNANGNVNVPLSCFSVFRLNNFRVDCDRVSVLAHPKNSCDDPSESNGSLLPTPTNTPYVPGTQTTTYEWANPMSLFGFGNVITIIREADFGSSDFQGLQLLLSSGQFELTKACYDVNASLIGSIGTTFYWTVTGDLKIESGQGTDTVKVCGSNGSASVEVIDDCGFEYEKELLIL